MESAVIRSVLSKCLSRNIETLIRKWGWFSDEDMQTIKFGVNKSSLAAQIAQLCKEKGMRKEIGDLDLLSTQLRSSSRTWTVLKLKGSLMKTDLDPQELQSRLATVLEAECTQHVHLNVNSYEGATWIRVYMQEKSPFRATDVVYILSYPHTPILIACRMKVKMRDVLYSALMEVFETEEITELQLTGHHLQSLADLALQQSAQGPFQKYREMEDNSNPLVKSKSFKSAEKKTEVDRRLNDENRVEKMLRQERLDSTFGTHTQPTLEKLEYKLDLRFRGTTQAPEMQGRRELFHCRVKFEGPSVLEGIKNLAKTGLATLPLPRHLARVQSLAKNHFTIGEMDPVEKPSASQNKRQQK